MCIFTYIYACCSLIAREGQIVATLMALSGEDQRGLAQSFEALLKHMMVSNVGMYVCIYVCVCVCVCVFDLIEV